MGLASQICFPLVANNEHVIYKFKVILRHAPKVKVEPLHERCYNQIHVRPCEAVYGLAHLKNSRLAYEGC